MIRLAIRLLTVLAVLCLAIGLIHGSPAGVGCGAFGLAGAVLASRWLR